MRDPSPNAEDWGWSDDGVLAKPRCVNFFWEKYGYVKTEAYRFSPNLPMPEIRFSALNIYTMFV